MDKNISKLLQNIVSTASIAADGAKNVMQQAGKVVADKYDEVKLNVELARLEEEQESVFSDIGRMIYLMHTGAVRETVMSDEGEKSPNQVIDSLLVTAEQLGQEMDLITGKLTEFRDEKICPCCGRLCAEQDSFCSVCGTKLEEQPEQPDACTEECSCGCAPQEGDACCEKQAEPKCACTCQEPPHESACYCEKQPEDADRQ